MRTVLLDIEAKLCASGKHVQGKGGVCREFKISYLYRLHAKPLALYRFSNQINGYKLHTYKAPLV